jgi:hypothetical protein
VLLVVLLIGLTVLYRCGPDRRAARWQWVTVGSVFAAVTSFANYNATYGSLGAVVGLMILDRIVRRAPRNEVQRGASCSPSFEPAPDQLPAPFRCRAIAQP